MNEILERDIRYLKGVGERRAELFCRLGVTTVGALIRYYPRSYINMRDTVEIAAAPFGEPVAVCARVCLKNPSVRLRGGKTLIRVLASDGTSDFALVWFNNEYAAAALDIGTEYVFYGKLSGTLTAREMINPLVVKPCESDALTPQYSLTAGLSSRIIAGTVRAALTLSRGQISESMPLSLMRKYDLIGLEQAIYDIHFPQNLASAKRAKDRLIFEELLTLSLGLAMMKGRSRELTSVKIANGSVGKFISSLPYQLTRAQKRCIDEISADLSGPTPMNRLLQGDVGSGKTVCAAAAVLCAASSGYQSAVMAPTEILATQHAKTFKELLAPFDITVGLLTGAVKGKERAALLQSIAEGTTDLVVGTHAVLGDAVRFSNLGFVVADEQHRFGVEQRALLSKKGERPHLLVMSATPIPRTLALIIYGDLDISILDEIPPGRSPVKTLLVSDKLRERYLGFVRKTVGDGHQAYIVCPLVEESETLSDTVSATEYRDELEKNYLKGLALGLIHGRMKSGEKERVMSSFARGETQVLVSTTVVEVGLDIPNATLMIIENAERFGLSALHQLRGRVGRGASESWCVLVSDAKSEVSKARLSVMTHTNDGFEISREDLNTRGPGDFFGRRQHGLPALAIADLASDERVLHGALEAAKALLKSDPELSRPEHAELKAQTVRMFAQTEATLN
ncbi:MAG: ATP-dependent DNA helicase RecG [Oscillospiraceae bacterium]